MKYIDTKPQCYENMDGKNPCPKCSSSDAFHLYEDHGYCYSCSYTERWDVNRYNMNNVEKKGSDVQFIEGEIRPLTKRKINESICQKWGVTCGEDKSGKKIYLFNHYDSSKNLIGQKARYVKESSKDDRFPFSLGNVSNLYGKWKCNTGRMLVIVEGEIDALSVAQVQNDKYPVVAIPNGAQSAKNVIKKELNWIEKNFEEVILLFDQDEAGQNAVLECAPLFSPGKCKIAKLSTDVKDVNELLMRGRGSEIQSAIWTASYFEPGGILKGQDLWDYLNQEIDRGVSLPWNSLSDATYGIRKGEVWIWTAGSGVGKCLAKDTPVIMSDLSIKSVQDIMQGEQVLGPDGIGRLVTSTISGKELMYKVTPNKGDAYTVNESHILSLYASRTKGIFKQGEIYNIPVKEYLELSSTHKSLLKTWRPSEEMSFTSKEDFLIDPYYVGLWLGDGNTEDTRIHNVDEEVINYLKHFAFVTGTEFKSYTPEGRCPYHWVKFNKLNEELKRFGMGQIKNIPHWVKFTSIDDRYRLIAGLIDSDGNLTNHGTGFEFVQKNKQIFDSFVFICRSLGLMVSENIKMVNGVAYYRAHVFGHTHKIPTIIDRKQAKKREINKNPNVHGFSIDCVGEGDYYGFTLEGKDRLFLLGDFQVTHNTTSTREVAYHLIEKEHQKVGIISLEESPTQTIKRLAGLHLNKPIYLPGVNETDEERLSVFKELIGNPDKLIICKHDGNSDYDFIFRTMRHMVIGEGCTHIILDHLTAIVEGKGGDVNSECHRVMEGLNRFCQETGVTIHLVSHIRKSMSGTSSTAEEGGRVRLDDLYGSGAIKQRANFVIALERDQQSDDPEERDQTTIRVLKDRNTGQSTGFTCKLGYDHDTGRLYEAYNDAIFGDDSDTGEINY